jgi:hypothetical protein
MLVTYVLALALPFAVLSVPIAGPEPAASGPDADLVAVSTLISYLVPSIETVWQIKYGGDEKRSVPDADLVAVSTQLMLLAIC